VEGDRVAWKFDPMHKTTSPMPFFAKSFEAFARRVACRVLFVSGGALGWHPPDEEERLAAFARLERVELAEAGHMMHWTKPAELVEALVRFWNEDLIPRRSRRASP
jgi:pimeloyl-ACP methyl ester carboxylesterase